MNKNELKAATDAFLDELIEVKYSHSTSNGYKIYSIKVSGRDAGAGNQDNIGKRVATLRVAIGKMFRKHLKAILEQQTAAAGDAAQEGGG